jgi:hypothetical protein
VARSRNPSQVIVKKQILEPMNKILSIIAFLLLPTAILAPCKGEEHGGEVAPLQYRKILAPADRLGDWPTGDGKYLPLETKEFERLLSKLKPAGDAETGLPSAMLRRAEYRAVWEDGLLAGRAELEIELHADSPALHPLDPCAISIRNPQWEIPKKEKKNAAASASPPNDKKEETAVEKAILGTMPHGKLGVVIERSGKLSFDWALAERRRTGGIHVLAGELPAAATTTLVLDLPDDFEPKIDQGLIQEPRVIEKTKSNRWRIEWGANARFELKIVPRSRRDAAGDLPSLRETRSYDLSPRGVDLAVQWKLQGRGDSLRQIAVLLDPGLELVSASCGETSATWTLETLPSHRGQRAVIQLPPPYTENVRTLRLGAIAPLKMDRRWRLPRLRAEAARWDDGTITVTALRPLSLEGLKPVECNQTATGPAIAPRAGETMQFRSFDAGATVEVSLALHRETLAAPVVTAVEITGGQMTARVTGLFRATESSLFSLEAAVAPSWQIEEVSAVPAEAIADWNLEPQADGHARLIVRLAKSIGPDRPLKLVVAARRLRLPTEQGTKFADLQPLRFLPPVESRCRIALRTIAENELKIQGVDPSSRVLLKDIPPAERELFAGTAEEQIYSAESSADAEVVIERRRPEYAATIQMEVEAAGKRIRENWIIRCEPGSSPVEKIPVLLFGKSETTAQWKAAGTAGLSLTATVHRSAHDQPSNHPPEIWEIVLSRPQTMPFTLEGTREIAFAGSTPIGLVFLPEAKRQTGALVVRRSAKEGIRVENRRLKRLPPEPSGVDAAPYALATFSYDPARDAVAETPPIRLAPEELPNAAPHAWSSCLESWIDPEGNSRHTAVWDLQLGDRDRTTVTLPEGVGPSDVSGVWLDSRPAAWQPTIEIDTKAKTPDSSKISVALPTDKRFAKLSIEFAVREKPLGALGTIAPRLPKIDLPVLSSNWQLWLPAGYQAVAGQSPGIPLFAPRESLGKSLWGPLGRDAGDGRFRFFSAEDWAAIAGDPTRRRARQHLENTVKYLAQSLDRVEKERKSGPATWRDLFGSAIEPGFVKFIVDRAALDRLGISGESALPSIDFKESALRVEELLQKSKLSLLLAGDSILITSRLSASLYERQWTKAEFPGTGILAPGPLADCLSEALHEDAQPRYLSASLWAQLPPPVELPWERGVLSELKAFPVNGWNVVRQEMSRQDDVALHFVHRPTFRIAGLALFIAVIAVGCWRFLHRTIELSIATAVSAFFSLTLADPFAGVTSWAMLGLLFCFVARFAIRKRSIEARPALSSESEDKPPLPNKLESTIFQEDALPKQLEDGSSGGSLGSTAIIALLVAITLTFASRAVAEDAPKNPLAVPAAPVYRVFVPTDTEKNPVGDKVYVPDAFYNELFRRAEIVSEKPRDWLLTHAIYRGSLVRGTTTGKPAVELLRVQYDLRVFNRSVRVKIPLQLDDPTSPPENTMLDGRPLKLLADPQGSAFVFDIEEPGEYRLEFSLKPAPRNDNGDSGIDLAIPRVAGARLELLLPADSPVVEVPSALGKVAVESVPPRTVADLGPTDRMTIRWRENGTGAAVAEIEKLLWLNIQPGSVVLDVRLKANALAGRLQKLQLAVDPRLRLQPVAGSGAPSVQVHNPPDRPQIITLEWANPLPEQTAVGLSFLWTGASGVGKVGVPQFEVQNFPAGKRWLAVSVDPQLEYALPRSAEDTWFKPETESLPVADFLKAWGIPASTPAAACRLGENADWRLSVKPREPVVAADPTLDLSFDRDRVEVDFSAELNVVSGYLFQYRLVCPKEFAVQSLSVKKDGMELVGRWTREDDGAITVFLTGPAEGRHKLKLHGSAPLAGKTTITIPKASIEQVAYETTLVRIYRRPGVLLEITSPAEAETLSQNSEAETAVPGRLVRAYRVSDKASLLGSVVLEPNNPVFEAQQLVWLRQEDRQWRAGVEYRVQVLKGVVDEFQCEVSPSWIGPFTTTSTDDIRVSGAPGERRRLTVVPRHAIQGEYTFGFAGLLKFEPGERPALPEIALRHSRELSRWAAMPRMLQGQETRWETIGLEDVKLPQVFAGAIDPLLFDICKATSDRPEAVLRQQGQNNASPRISLADIQVAWQTDGAWRAVAAFDLVPGGISVCPLQLPPGSEMISASIDGIPARAQSLKQGGWQLNLHSDRLPQRVTVVYRGTMAEADGPGTRDFAAVLLGEIPVEQTLWTVSGPTCFALGESAEKDPLRAAEREWLRLRRLDDVIDRAANLFSEDNTETWRWYRLHLRYWAAARSAVLRQLLPISQTGAGRAMQKELETLENRQRKLAARLEMSEVLLKLLTATPPASEPEQWWSDMLFDRETAVGFEQKGRLASLSLNYAWAEKSQTLERFWAICAIAAFLAIFLWGIRKGFWNRLLEFSPSANYLLFGLIGIAWWLWLSPSWLGCAILLATAVAWASTKKSRTNLARSFSSAHSKLRGTK